MYRVFVRNWWKEGDPAKWPNGLEPDPTAKKEELEEVETEEEAREIAQAYNRANPPGRLSRKAEFEEV